MSETASGTSCESEDTFYDVDEYVVEEEDGGIDVAATLSADCMADFQNIKILFTDML